MEYIAISHYLAVFIIIFYSFVHIYCDVLDSERLFTSTSDSLGKLWSSSDSPERLMTTSDSPERLLTTLSYRISDDYIHSNDPEAHCIFEHMKCLDNNPRYKLIGAWDIFNSKWKLHTVCEIQNSECILDKVAYRYNNSGYDTWILI